MAREKIKGPASYFPSIEKTYGKPIAEWKALIRSKQGLKHMELVNWLRRSTAWATGMRTRLSRTLSQRADLTPCPLSLRGEGKTTDRSTPNDVVSANALELNG